MCWCSNVSLIFINIHEGNGLLSESTRPYLNQCWLTICGTVWNTPKYSFHRNAFLYLLLSKCIWTLSLAKTHFAPQSVSRTQPGTLWALMNDIIYFSLTNRKEGAYIIPIRKSKDYVYGIWVYKALDIWKGYYRVKKSLVSYVKPWTEAKNNKYMKYHSKLTYQLSFWNVSRKVDYHAGGKWFIHGPKRRKENQLLSLKHPCWLSLV